MPTAAAGQRALFRFLLVEIRTCQSILTKQQLTYCILIRRLLFGIGRYFITVKE